MTSHSGPSFAYSVFDPLDCIFSTKKGHIVEPETIVVSGHKLIRLPAKPESWDLHPYSHFNHWRLPVVCPSCSQLVLQYSVCHKCSVYIQPDNKCIEFLKEAATSIDQSNGDCLHDPDMEPRTSKQYTNIAPKLKRPADAISTNVSQTNTTIVTSQRTALKPAPQPHRLPTILPTLISTRTTRPPNSSYLVSQHERSNPITVNSCPRIRPAPTHVVFNTTGVTPVSLVRDFPAIKKRKISETGQHSSVLAACKLSVASSILGLPRYEVPYDYVCIGTSQFQKVEPPNNLLLLYDSFTQLYFPRKGKLPSAVDDLMDDIDDEDDDDDDIETVKINILHTKLGLVYFSDSHAIICFGLNSEEAAKQVCSDAGLSSDSLISSELKSVSDQRRKWIAIVSDRERADALAGMFDFYKGISVNSKSVLTAMRLNSLAAKSLIEVCQPGFLASLDANWPSSCMSDDKIVKIKQPNVIVNKNEESESSEQTKAGVMSLFQWPTLNSVTNLLTSVKNKVIGSSAASGCNENDPQQSTNTSIRQPAAAATTILTVSSTTPRPSSILVQPTCVQQTRSLVTTSNLRQTTRVIPSLISTLANPSNSPRPVSILTTPGSTGSSTFITPGLQLVSSTTLLRANSAMAASVNNTCMQNLLRCQQFQQQQLQANKVPSKPVQDSDDLIIVSESGVASNNEDSNSMDVTLHTMDTRSATSLVNSTEDSTDNSQLIPIATNKPPPRLAGEIIEKFTYAPMGSNGISLSNEDLMCLNPTEFLNDFVIDFYLKYMFHEILTQEQQKKTYIFNCFFYKRLTSKLEPNKPGEQLSASIRRHATVAKWTRKVDLFDKDFIIIPINEQSHWFLAIICFPWLVGSVNYTTLFSADGLSNTTDAIKSVITAPDGTLRMPCILIFDSLTGSTRSPNVRMLREYLQVEWDIKRRSRSGAKIFDKDTIRGFSPRVPIQPNFYDCGLYVLHYAELFFKRRVKAFTKEYFETEMFHWFSHDEIVNKRAEIQDLIIDLYRKIGKDSLLESPPTSTSHDVSVTHVHNGQ